jgi:hypothetical protein
MKVLLLLSLVFLMAPGVSFAKSGPGIDVDIEIKGKAKIWTKDHVKLWKKIKQLKGAIRVAEEKAKNTLNNVLTPVINSLRVEIERLEREVSDKADSSELDSLSTEFVLLGHRFDEVKAKLNKNSKDIKGLKKKAIKLTGDVERLKKDTWGFGLYLAGGVDLGSFNGEVMNVNSFGMSLYLRKDRIYFRALLGAGFTENVNFGWTFAPSAEYEIVDDLCVGAVVVFNHDMGDMEGWQSIGWSGGGIVRYSLIDRVSVWITLTTGLTGERGEVVQKGEREVRNDPTYEFSFGSLAGVNFDIL